MWTRGRKTASEPWQFLAVSGSTLGAGAIATLGYVELNGARVRDSTGLTLTPGETIRLAIEWTGVTSLSYDTPRSGRRRNSG